MVKKLKAIAEQQKRKASAGLFDSEMAASVRESAEKIWLAGMGAFAKAQAEGKQVFETLVKEGTSLQKKTQSAAEEKLGEVAGKVSSMAEDVQAKAGQHWGNLESIFEERTKRAMGRLGVPSASDVKALADRVAALEAQLAGGPRAAAKRTLAKKSTAAKRPASKSAAKSRTA